MRLHREKNFSVQSHPPPCLCGEEMEISMNQQKSKISILIPYALTLGFLSLIKYIEVQ